MGEDLRLIRDHWEKSWAELGDSLLPILAPGGVDISRMLHLVDQYSSADEVVGSVQNTFAERNKLPRDSNGKCLFALFVAAGKYVILPRSVRVDMALADMVVGEIVPETQYVIELGSGWGRNLFRVYCRLAGNTVKFRACEFTETGRQVTARISELDERMDCAVHDFDYRRPDLSFLVDKPNVVFFTHHSIEQIRDLSVGIFDLMLEKTGKCTCVHFEPVGWQRFSALKELAAEGPEAVGKHEYVISDDQMPKNAAAWSIAKGYNRNLLGLLDGLQRAGKIRFKQTIYEIFGQNPFNPATCIVWEKI